MDKHTLVELINRILYVGYMDDGDNFEPFYKIDGEIIYSGASHELSIFDRNNFDHKNNQERSTIITKVRIDDEDTRENIIKRSKEKFGVISPDEVYEYYDIDDFYERIKDMKFSEALKVIFDESELTTRDFLW